MGQRPNELWCDAELQNEIFDLLREHDAEIRSEKWLELSCVLIEAVLVACHEAPGGVTYVSDLGAIAEEILKRRGKESKIDPGKFGKRLKHLGFATEPRDAKGSRLCLKEAVRDRAQQLARDFGIPEV